MGRGKMRRIIMTFLSTMKFPSLSPGGGRSERKIYGGSTVWLELVNSITVPLISHLCIFCDLFHCVYCTNSPWLLYSCIQSSTGYLYLQVSNASQVVGFPKPSPPSLSALAMVFTIHQGHEVIPDSAFSLSSQPKWLSMINCPINYNLTAIEVNLTDVHSLLSCLIGVAQPSLSLTQMIAVSSMLLSLRLVLQYLFYHFCPNKHTHTNTTSNPFFLTQKLESYSSSSHMSISHLCLNLFSGFLPD